MDYRGVVVCLGGSGDGAGRLYARARILFAAAITSAARQPDAALALLRYLTSPGVTSTILKAGLTPPAGK